MTTATLRTVTTVTGNAKGHVTSYGRSRNGYAVSPKPKTNSETSEGYSKSVTIDGNPGREDYDKEKKVASLWVMVAKRYFVEIELQKQDPKELQEWIKRVDLKKLAEIKK